MRKAIPAICSTEPLTVLKRVVSVKSPKVSPSKISSGKCSSVVSRDNCASACRRTVTDGFTFVIVPCADASSSTIFHSPGRPSPETVLRKPGGGSLSLAPLKSKYRSAAAPGQAIKTKTTQTIKRNIAPQRNKTEPADKCLARVVRATRPPSPATYVFSAVAVQADGARRSHRFSVARTRGLYGEDTSPEIAIVKRPEGRAPSQTLVRALNTCVACATNAKHVWRRLSQIPLAVSQRLKQAA